MKAFKNVLAGLLIAATTLSMAACGSSGSAGSGSNSGSDAPAPSATAAAQEIQDKVIKVATTSDPASLGTYDEGSSSGRWITLSFTYETLVFIDNDGSFRGILAKDWSKNEELSKDGKAVYDVEIYDYITDTAGNHLTADDVIFSYNEALNNGKGNQHSALTGGMESIEKTGDYSIRFTWKRDSAGEFEDAMSKVLVVSQKAYEDSGDCMRTKPVATGPYYVKDWSTGTSLTLAKNEDYWQKPELCGTFQKQNADEIVFYFVSEASQIAIGLETGSYDMNNTLNYTNASRFMEGGADAANFTVNAEPDAFLQQLWINRSEESPLHDLRIAQAVLYAIDQDGLIQAVSEGHGTKVYCYGTSMNIGYQQKWETEDYYNYNVDKAKELLADAGVTDGSLNLTILCDNDETRVKIAQVIKLYLAEVGINAEITSFDQALWNTYQTDPTKFDINISYNGGWGYITRTWNQLDSTRYEAHNMAMVRDDTLDNLIHTAQVSQDAADIDAAKQYMTENAFHYGLYRKEVYGITSKAKVTEAVYDYRGNLVPGACTYVWN